MGHDFGGFNQRIIDMFRTKGGRNIGNFGDRLLLLTTVGAKSGRRRTTPLAYSRDGDRYVVVASKGGAPTNPAWYHNLIVNPIATVEVGTETFQARAAPARGTERDRLYASHAALLPVFLEYPRKTTRVIPVLILERLAA